MKHDAAASIEFLKWFRPGGPWVLSAIVPDGRISTMTFRADQEEMLRKWLDGRAGHENIYFQVNSSGDQNLTKKATKKQITAAQWLHIDIDPSADASLFDAERKRILKRLKEHSVAPSLIIDSGGGFQGFWRLSEDVKTEDWAEFERHNRQLETDLGGDHCHNVDRIMRLPGTINVPNKKKAKAGRKKALTKVVFQDDKTFELSVFPQAPLLDGGESGDIGRERVQLSGNLPRLNEVDDLDQHGEVSSHVKMMIVQGMDPDRPDKYESRSEAFWFVCCELVRCKIPNDVIGSVLLDPDFMISGHALDQKNPEGYVVRQLQRAHEHAFNPALPTMNDYHFTTIMGGKFKIGCEWEDGVMEFWDKGTFMDHYLNDRVEIGMTKESVPITMPKGKWWLEQPTRRSYKRGIVFDPSDEAPPDTYNLWRGFTVSAVSGNKHHKFLDHLRDNICSGNEEHFDYLIKWCARLVQSPATQSETAIVLRGKEGTGKNSFVETLGHIFGRHYFEATHAARITGNFNAHLRDKVLVHANEAFFAGDRRQEAALKGMITDPTIAIEAKGVDITMQDNFIHLIMSSNSEWVVPAGPESRRFLVLDVSDAKMQDGDYFAAMKRDLRDGGYEHLLRFLLDLNLSSFNVRKVPVTEALREQRIHTMPKVEQWWMSRLDRGYVVDSRDGWKERIQVEHVWQSYVKDMQEVAENYRSSRIEFGQILHRIVPNLGKKRFQRSNEKVPFYIVPDLEKCRTHFDEVMGGPFKWGEMEITVQEDIPF